MAFTTQHNLASLVRILMIVKQRLVDWLEDTPGQSYQSAYSLLVGLDRRQP